MDPVLGYSSDRSIQYIILPYERIPEALKLCEQHFFPYACVSNALEIHKNPKALAEMISLVAEFIKDNVSIAAIENNSNKMVGCSINTLQTKSTNSDKSYSELFGRKFQQKESRNLMNFLVHFDSYADIFDVLEINKVLDITYLVTAAEYRRRCIGTDLIKYDLKLLDQLKSEDNSPQAVTGSCSSNYSQKIFEKLNFIVLSTIYYDDLTHNGFKFLNRIDKQHKTIKLMVKKI